jgi:F0F1-type ATP synthase membrane subunit b/b'
VTRQEALRSQVSELAVAGAAKILKRTTQGARRSLADIDASSRVVA